MSDAPIEKDASRLTKIYRRIREAREANTSAYKKRDEEFKSQLDTVSKLLIDLMDEQKTVGINTTEGSVSKVIKQKFWTVDWPAFNAFVKEHDLFDLYEKRIAQTNMAEWIAANPDNIPPGTQMDRRYDVLVRKPTKKPE